jgi:hypothetical protein
MTIDRDIILDLLPLCQSGLASASSRRLVEDWLRDHPQQRSGALALPTGPDDTTAALARARRLRRWQRRLYGFAIGFTVLCLSAEFHIEQGRLVAARLLALDHPLPFVPVVLAAIACWTGYALLKRRLS